MGGWLRPGAGRDLRRVALTSILLAAGPAEAQSHLTVILTGQSMIRSDLRSSAPEALAKMQSLLKGGDVVFTNLEGTIAEPGESAGQGRGFLAPPGALDALSTLGFNLLALADNHAFDLKLAGIGNTLAETRRRGIAHAGIGTDLATAAAPGYLELPQITVALVASASGLIATEGNATATRPGVNELRILAGGQANEGTADLPAAATGAKAGYILARLAALSQPFGTRLEVAGDGARISLCRCPQPWRLRRPLD